MRCPQSSCCVRADQCQRARTGNHYFSHSSLCRMVLQFLDMKFVLGLVFLICSPLWECKDSPFVFLQSLCFKAFIFWVKPQTGHRNVLSEAQQPPKELPSMRPPVQELSSQCSQLQSVAVPALGWQPVRGQFSFELDVKRISECLFFLCVCVCTCILPLGLHTGKWLYSVEKGSTLIFQLLACRMAAEPLPLTLVLLRPDWLGVQPL